MQQHLQYMFTCCVFFSTAEIAITARFYYFFTTFFQHQRNCIQFFCAVQHGKMRGRQKRSHFLFLIVFLRDYHKIIEIHALNVGIERQILPRLEGMTFSLTPSISVSCCRFKNPRSAKIINIIEVK